MRLQKNISRRTKDKVYEKWSVNIPEDTITKLGWTPGINLKAEILDNKLILFGEKEKLIKEKIEEKGSKKLSYYERFMRVYDSLPLEERKLPVIVIDEQPIIWKMACLEIKEKTGLGRKIGEKLIKLRII